MTEAQNSLNLGRRGNQSNVGEFVLVSSQRNPTPLFGAGLIDAVPDRVLEEAAKVKHADFPEVAGRVSRLKDKRIGRFGWKAQTPSLQDFVLTACAVELGLEVPGHHQAGLPQKPDAKAKGLDLTADECNALESYVRGLSKPAERRPSIEADAREIDGGRKLFASVGCATCHTPKLGQVNGIYSDLLLHDMGQQLGDTGQYSVFDPGSSEEEFVDEDPGPIADASSTPAVDLDAIVVVQSSANACPTPGSGGRGQAADDRSRLALRVAHPALVGLPRLGPVSPRRPGRNARPGRGLARRRGLQDRREVLRPQPARTPTARGVPQVAHRPGADVARAGRQREVISADCHGFQAVVTCRPSRPSVSAWPSWHGLPGRGIVFIHGGCPCHEGPRARCPCHEDQG